MTRSASSEEVESDGPYGSRGVTECPRMCLLTTNCVYMFLGVCMTVVGIYEVTGDWRKYEVAGMPGGVNLIVTGFLIIVACLLGCGAVQTENSRYVIAYGVALGLLTVMDIIFICLHFFVKQTTGLKEEFEKLILKKGIFQEVRYSVTFELLSIVVNTVLLVYAYIFYRQVV